MAAFVVQENVKFSMKVGYTQSGNAGYSKEEIDEMLSAKADKTALDELSSNAVLSDDVRHIKTVAEDTEVTSDPETLYIVMGEEGQNGTDD